MIWTAGSRSGHLDDRDLLAYGDHALDRTGQRRVERHLDACPECRARLEEARARTELIGGWLSELDVPVAAARRDSARAAMEAARFRPRSDRGGVFAAAASIALVMTLAFGTPPGRAWVGSAGEWLGGAPEARVAEEVSVAEEGGAAEPAAVAAPAPADPPATRAARAARADGPAEPAPGTSAAVAFDPRSNYVLIRFDSRQRVGTAAIWVRDEDAGSAQVVAGYRAEALLPTADGLLVRNARGSRAEYVIVVPTRYRYLRVRVGDEPETLITIARSNRDWLWTLNLSE